MTCGYFGTAISSVAIVVGALFLGSLYYYYKSQQQKIHHEINAIKKMGIQIQALNELINRYQPNHLHLPEMKLENIFVDGKKSLILGVSLMCVLGFSYWGATDILMTLGFLTATSILASPIGLGIALSAAIILGVIITIHYQNVQKEQNPIKALKKGLESELNEKKVYLAAVVQINNHENENKYTSQNHRFFKRNIMINKSDESTQELIRRYSF